MMNFSMAGCEDPVRSARPTMAAVMRDLYVGLVCLLICSHVLPSSKAMVVLHPILIISMFKKRSLDTTVIGAVINAALFFQMKVLDGLYGFPDPLLWKVTTTSIFVPCLAC